MLDIIKSVILGIIEGITEWLPISSTGHLILSQTFLSFSSKVAEGFTDMFNYVIQLGAILAVVVIYFKQMWPFSLKKEEHYIKKDVYKDYLILLVD